MKVLLVQTSFLGDTVLSTPVIAGIKKLWPSCELWMMVTPLAKSLVVRDPLLAGVIAFEKRGSEAGLRGLFAKARKLREMRFDRAYSLHKSVRTSILLALAGIPKRIGFSRAKLAFLYHDRVRRREKEHDVLRNLSLLSNEAALESFEAELRLTAPTFAELSAPVQALTCEPGYVVLAPGSAWRTKMWNWRGYKDVCQHFLRLGKRVAIIGGPGEEEVVQKVAEGTQAKILLGQSLEETLTIIKNAELVVCNDSLALHVASAFKVPTVTVFCATSPNFGFGPWRNRASVLEVPGLECKPCRRHGGKRCPTGTELCMTEVSSSQVISAAERLLHV